MKSTGAGTRTSWTTPTSHRCSRSRTSATSQDELAVQGHAQVCAVRPQPVLLPRQVRRRGSAARTRRTATSGRSPCASRRLRRPTTRRSIGSSAGSPCRTSATIACTNRSTRTGPRRTPARISLGRTRYTRNSSWRGADRRTPSADVQRPAGGCSGRPMRRTKSSAKAV